MDRTRRRRLFDAALAAAAAVVLFASGLGCGGDDVQQDQSGTINVFPDPVTFSTVAVGSEASETFTIRNNGRSDLRIFKTNFRAVEGASIADLEIPDLSEDGFTLAPQEERSVEVKFAPEKAGRTNVGLLEIYNSDPEHGENKPYEVDIRTSGNSPTLRVNPEPIRFTPRPPGDSETETATLHNVGEAPLEIYDVSISGSDDFQIQNVSEELTAELPAASKQDEEQTVEVDIRYAPTSDGSRTAELVIESNEEPGATKESPERKRVEINANADTPCLNIVGKTKRELGAVPIGGSASDTIVAESCESKPLRISSVQFAENSDDGEFSVDLGSRDGNADGDLDEEVVLDSEGDRAQFPVRYEPVQEGTDRAFLELRTNDPFWQKAEIELSARGATGECPETKLRGRPEGGTRWDRQVVRAAPLDYILLDGSESQDPDGRIEKYNWRFIEKPDGASDDLDFEPWEQAPDSDTSKRRIRMLVAGDYKVGLTVKDNDGFQSCEEAVLELSAQPDEKVHVELTWENPNDPDQSDDNGDDVDVHLVKMGPGEWFDEPYDVYFKNPNRGEDAGGGGGIWNPESPSLDIDDRNSLGPENIQMDDPQDCQWYAIGAHYWEERFPPAFATVRVYLGEGMSNLVYERLNVKLEEGGTFWDIARIHWPSQQVVSVDRFYDSKAAVEETEPEVTSAMKNSDLCTSQDLYPTQ